MNNAAAKIDCLECLLCFLFSVTVKPSVTVQGRGIYYAPLYHSICVHVHGFEFAIRKKIPVVYLLDLLLIYILEINCFFKYISCILET